MAGNGDRFMGWTAGSNSGSGSGSGSGLGLGSLVPGPTEEDSVKMVEDLVDSVHPPPGGNEYPADAYWAPPPPPQGCGPPPPEYWPPIQGYGEAPPPYGGYQPQEGDRRPRFQGSQAPGPGHPLYRKKMCPLLGKTGYCKFGKDCSFCHSRKEYRRNAFNK